MAKTNATGRNEGAAKHVRHYEWMLKSTAYRALNCHSRCLLTELGRRYDSGNNGDVSMSVREAAKLLGCAIDTACKAFRQLEDRGFIRPHEKGAFHVKVRHATTWILTEFSYAGQKPTKDFMSWEKQNTVLAGSTNGTSTSHRVPATSTEKSPHGPSEQYRHRQFQPPHGTNG